jgi:outer membrane protein assembly factor BamE (lipoprotein component of BamABCDE complex)
MEEKQTSGCAFKVFIFALFGFVLFIIGFIVFYVALGWSTFKFAKEKIIENKEIVQPFDKELWQNKYMDKNKSFRSKMLNDIQYNYLKKGIPKDSVLMLLGNPDSISNQSIIYFVGYTMNESEQKETNLFILNFDNNNRLTNEFDKNLE